VTIVIGRYIGRSYEVCADYMAVGLSHSVISVGCILYHCIYGCVFCVLLFDLVNYVFLLLCYVFLLLCLCILIILLCTLFMLVL
jgi:hypothetical protein